VLKARRPWVVGDRPKPTAEQEHVPRLVGLAASGKSLTTVGPSLRGSVGMAPPSAPSFASLPPRSVASLALAAGSGRGGPAGPRGGGIEPRGDQDRGGSSRRRAGSNVSRLSAAPPGRPTEGGPSDRPPPRIGAGGEGGRFGWLGRGRRKGPPGGWACRVTRESSTRLAGGGIERRRNLPGWDGTFEARRRPARGRSGHEDLRLVTMFQGGDRRRVQCSAAGQAPYQSVPGGVFWGHRGRWRIDPGRQSPGVGPRRAG